MQKIKDGNDFLYFPDGDTHFTGKNKDGEPAWKDYQLDRLKAAIPKVTDFRIAIDVGAHVGLLTRAMARAFETVYAFEPDPENFACLRLNTCRLPNVVCMPVALGEDFGRARMDKNKTNSGDSQIAERKNADISIRPLDSYEFPDIGLIKIDVQGYEGKVLRGARDLIQAFAPVVIVECEPPYHLRFSYAEPGIDEVANFFGQKHWDVPLFTTVRHDRIYVPGPNGVKPYTKYAERGDYHWTKFDPGKTSGQCLLEVIRYINEQPHATVLDVGCGDGHLTSMLKGATGIDDNGVAVALAKKHGVNCYQLSTYRARKLNRRFDAATLFDVLEHLPRQKQALRALAELTEVLYILNPDPVGTHWHTHEFTESKLVKFVTDLGWKVKHSQRFENSTRNKKTFLHLVR